jgi:hypothetical protein
MIYPSFERAQEVANMLNARGRGYGPGSFESRPVLEEHGWTVIGRYVWND